MAEKKEDFVEIAPRVCLTEEIIALAQAKAKKPAAAVSKEDVKDTSEAAALAELRAAVVHEIKGMCLLLEEGDLSSLGPDIWDTIVRLDKKLPKKMRIL
jgi:hypothetical protein